MSVQACSRGVGPLAGPSEGIPPIAGEPAVDSGDTRPAVGSRFPGSLINARPSVDAILLARLRDCGCGIPFPRSEGIQGKIYSAEK